MIYPDLNAAKRTDEKFRNGSYKEHRKKETVILDLPIDIIKDFPIADSLHIIDLGDANRKKNYYYYSYNDKRKYLFRHH